MATLTLYHGTTVGWLMQTGFRKPNFASGEFTNPHPFFFLCTQKEGAESAACKALTQVKNRYDEGSTQLTHYTYENHQVAVAPYIYEIEVCENARVLDFHAKCLSSADLHLIKKAIWLTCKRRTCRGKWAMFEALMNVHLSPKTWFAQLDRAYPCRNRMVRALGRIGFDLIRNLERDGDGQQYGEVWGLPISRVSRVTFKSCHEFKR